MYRNCGVCLFFRDKIYQYSVRMTVCEINEIVIQDNSREIEYTLKVLKGREL